MIPANLAPLAARAALEFSLAFPSVAFTSGVREIAQQASDMAANVVKSGNRNWIGDTYAASDACVGCQEWIDANPQAVTQADIATGLLGVLQTFTPAELRHLSLHFVGCAWDVQPPSDITQRGLVAAFLTRLAVKYGGRFLPNEGGLLRFHFQVPYADPT